MQLNTRIYGVQDFQCREIYHSVLFVFVINVFSWFESRKWLLWCELSVFIVQLIIHMLQYRTFICFYSSDSWFKVTYVLFLSSLPNSSSILSSSSMRGKLNAVEKDSCVVIDAVVYNSMVRELSAMRLMLRKLSTLLHEVCWLSR